MSYIGNTPTSAAYVTDTFSGNGSTTAFTMSVAPASTSSMLVAISGVLQDPSTYAIVGMTLNFSAAPPIGTGNISVRYLGIPASGVTNTAYRTVSDFTATAGQTTWTVPSYTPGFIDVFRNGARLGAADFTATNGTSITLAVAANALDLITTVSFNVSSVLNAIPATAGAVTSTYIADAAVTQTKLAAGVAGTGPAFSAYANSAQSWSSGTWTKIQFQVEEFDTANCFDNSTNYRFTPTVAGYYQVNGSFKAGGSNITITSINVYKNGSEYKQGTNFTTSGTMAYNATVAVLVYLNGSTDYIELYGWVTAASGAGAANGGSAQNYFQASLVRAA